MKEDKMITEYLVLTNEPQTKTVHYKDNTYTSDVLVGLKIPSSTKVDPSKVSKCEIKFSPNMNIPGVKKSALDVAKMFYQNEEKLRNGELYAKVDCYMSPRSRDNVVQNYVPYLNDIELVAVSEETKPYIDAAIRSIDDGGV